MDLKILLEQKLGEPTTCYGHCNQPSSFQIISDRPLIACHHCMAGYVSRIMVYGNTIDLPLFKDFIANAIGDTGTVHEEDVRLATRHAWDFPDLTGEVKVAYWTQNYRRSKNDDPNRTALFLCGKCDSLFLQPLNGRSVLCANCRAGA
jgi:DNA-directed RNA polymerase subunit RPC12/RpoP